VALMLAAETDLFATGDMGIANTTPSSAIVSVMTGAAVADVTGRGTGIDDAGLSLKVAVIEKALAVNRPDLDDAMDVLMKVGGFEIGGIAGLILGAASLRKPVLLDGFISTAGALIAQGLAPQAADYMIAAHKSVEAGHRIALQKGGKGAAARPGASAREGTGAALACRSWKGLCGY
jgi:nicotinate-nucleotide--dimethylbenzimidazole phosphoribosyltransferase